MKQIINPYEFAHRDKEVALKTGSGFSDFEWLKADEFGHRIEDERLVTYLQHIS